MNHHVRKAAFVERLDRARSAARRTQVWLGAFWAVFVFACGVGILAMGDYFLEWPWLARAVGLGVVGGIAVTAAAIGGVARAVRCGRLRTAVEIERRFPQLGQRVRTVVQFSGRREQEVSSEGVLPTLVRALEEEVEARARPVDLRDIIPWRKRRAVALLAGVSIALLAAGFSYDWETRLAIRRAFLADGPYTMLEIAPGDALVDEGRNLTLSFKVRGRTRRRVVLFTRRTGGGAGWRKRELALDEGRPTGERSVEYKLILENIKRSIEYRAVAGAAESYIHRVTVRHPLAIKEFTATVTPPAYTGLERKTVDGGDLEVIEGSRVKFRIRFDRPALAPVLVFADASYKNKDDDSESHAARVPLSLDDGVLAAEMQFRDDKVYWIAAKAREGPSPPTKRYHIRVRRDEAPRVRFEAPGVETLEVHSLAEVLMRIRASDDFGLRKAGIVFQVNDGEEQTLLAEGFPASAGRETKADQPKRTLRATCERMLPLEDYELTPSDSVMYFAFAEDNSPGGPKRTESDLRFLDIRSFQRVYKVGGT